MIQNIKLNTSVMLLLIIGIVIGSRLEILAQQNNWTNPICVASIVDADDLVIAEEDGSQKTIKPYGKTNAVGVK